MNNNFLSIKVLLFAIFLVLLSFIWQGNIGFGLADESYLWYGYQRVLLGEVPIRDFMSYDPGRYYFTAGLAKLFGDSGIMSLRAYVAVFQALGLFVGLFLIIQSRRIKSKSDTIFILLAAITLVVWMLPRHKLFDISISIFLVGILTYLILNPVSKRYFLTGVCVGLIAFFGRNHGVYGAIGSLGVIAWLSIQNLSNISFIKAISLWGGGVILGFSPIIMMSLFIPGFGIAFWESVRFLFELKATNLPLPIPWPWTVNFSAASFGGATRGVLIGLFFIGTLLFAGLSLAWVIYRRFRSEVTPPALVASAFLAIPYAHYAFSRADVNHLAQGIFPMLVGVIVLLFISTKKFKWPLVLVLCSTSLWVTYIKHPGWHCSESKKCVATEISGAQIKVSPNRAAQISLIKMLVDKYAPNGESYVVTPLSPGAYALFERKSPMWEIYALLPRNESFEEKEIERIKTSKPKFAIIYDYPLDGREELRFKNTHPLINQYFLDNFDILDSESIKYDPRFQIYISRD